MQHGDNMFPKRAFMARHGFMSYAPLRRAFMGCHLKEIEAIEPCAALGSVRAKPRWLRITRVKRSLEDPLLLLDEARHWPIQRDGAQ